MATGTASEDWRTTTEVGPTTSTRLLAMAAVLGAYFALLGLLGIIARLVGT